MSSSSIPTAFGEWKSSTVPFPIRYSQTLLQRIDFYVGDAYRRIPHGGLEVGGLLYGTFAEGALTLAAYQAIECQHSKGPGFLLSDKDVEELRRQIQAPLREDNVVLPAAGWFISHCRSELAMTEQEADLFRELFPAPHAVTLLVKPEKFKATQYGFLVPSAMAAADRRCRETFLLPLTPRVEGAGSEPIGPRPRQARRVPGREAVDAAAENAAGLPPGNGLAEVAPLYQTRDGGAARAPRTDGEGAHPAARTGGEEEQTPGRAAARERGLEAAEEGRAEPDAARAAAAGSEEHEELDEIEPPTFGMRGAAPRRTATRPRAAMVLAAMLAGVFSFAAIWTYLNFLLQPIPLFEQMDGEKRVVKWPAEMTAGADGPVLTVWMDGRPSVRPLTAREQERGEATLESAGKETIVQLRVHHLLYERRGLVRLLNVSGGVTAAPTARQP